MQCVVKPGDIAGAKVAEDAIKEQYSLRDFKELPKFRKVKDGIVFELPEEEKDREYLLGAIAANVVEKFLAKAVSVKEKLSTPLVKGRKPQEREPVMA